MDRSPCQFLALCHRREQVSQAAAAAGIPVPWDDLLVRRAPGSPEPLYDLRRSVVRCSERRLEALASIKANQEFQMLHKGQMSGYESSGWKDAADGYAANADEWARRAQEIVAILRELEETPGVECRLSWEEYLDDLRYELLARLHPPEDVDRILSCLRALNFDVAAAKTAELRERIVAAIPSWNIELYRMRCLGDAVQLLFSDLEALASAGS
jgi:hypothetical protein